MTAPTWQLGFDLDLLKGIEARFADYNAYSRTRFSEVTTADIARGLADHTLHVDDEGAVRWSTVKVGGPIRYHDLVLGHRQPGDRVVHAFTFDDPAVMAAHLDHIAAGGPAGTWAWIWQESPRMRAVVHRAGFRYIGSKVTSAAEIRGLYFRDGGGDLWPREHPPIDPTEHLGIARTTIRVDVSAAVAELDDTLKYTDHYSTYNVRRSWSALSLRGYSADPGFIVKPDEMSKAWQAEHDGEVFGLQDTAARAQLPAVDRLHAPLTDIAEPHRIRLMALSPNGGELRRHADLTDTDSGIGDGRVARFHFPLVTNDGVAFTSWDAHGERHTVNMRVGECWYLDTRKPHAAVNDGDTDRIHLVVDVVSNAAVRNLLERP